MKYTVYQRIVIFNSSFIGKGKVNIQLVKAVIKREYLKTLRNTKKKHIHIFLNKLQVLPLRLKI